MVGGAWGTKPRSVKVRRPGVLFVGGRCGLESDGERGPAWASAVGARTPLKRAGDTLGLCTSCFGDEVVRAVLDDASNGFEVGGLDVTLDVVEGESHEGAVGERELPRGLEARTDGRQEPTTLLPLAGPLPRHR